MPERRGRGRGRRERDFSSRDEERAARPRDAAGIRLFDFLQPQIGAEVVEDEEPEEEPMDEQPSWERDGIYRPRGAGRQDRGGYEPRGRRGRGGSYDDDDDRGYRRGRGGQCFVGSFLQTNWKLISFYCGRPTWAPGIISR